MVNFVNREQRTVSSTTTASLLARRIREHGVKYLYGIPGGASIPYIEKMRDEGIDFILTSHESSAAVMADVTARITGVTGVCHGTFGPGATNILTGVGGALLDRSPLIALTSVMSDYWQGRTAQMNIDHQSLFSPVTKASFRMSNDNADMIIHEAFSIANSEYPGPVHIGLPDDIANKEAKLFRYDKQHSQTIINPDVSNIISQSDYPVIAVGLTAARLGLGPGLLKFLSEHRVPVVVTPMAKGIIPYDHPCFAGVLFHALSDRLKPLTDKADLVIGLGYDPVEYNYESWIPDVPLVHFGTAITELPFKNATGYFSTPDSWFNELELLKSSSEMNSLAGDVRKDISETLYAGLSGFSPVEVFDIINDVLPDDSIITADVGSHLHILGQQWKIKPGGRLIITNGWSSMGFGLPAAVASALNEPDRTVVCITGDGGFMMSAGEMMTARRYGIKIIVVVMADGELNLIKIKEKRRGMKPLGIDLYVKPLFRAEIFLGTRVIYADTPVKLRGAFNDALRSVEPVIIEVAVNPASYGQLIVAI